MRKEQEDILNDVFADVKKEIRRQYRLKMNGKFKHTCADRPGLTDFQKLAVLMEEVGEVSRSIMNMDKIANDFLVKRFAREDEHLQKEIVQVAAVVCAWLMSFRKDQG